MALLIRSLALASCALAAVFSSPALAQSVRAQSLGDLGLWGVAPAGAAEAPPALWTGADPRLLALAFDRIGAPPKSPALQGLARRLATVAAEAPPGGAQDAGSARRRFALAARVARPDDAADMALRAPRLDLDPELSQIAVDAAFAADRIEPACRVVQALAGRIEPYWLQARAACFALRGEGLAADLAADLARAQGVTDPWFFAAIAAKTGAAPKAPATGQYGTGLAIALSRALKLVPAREADAGLSAAALVALARLSDLPAPIRAAYADRAAALGALDVAEHARILDDALAQAEAAAAAAAPPPAPAPAPVATPTLTQPGAVAASAPPAPPPPPPPRLGSPTLELRRTLRDTPDAAGKAIALARILGRDRTTAQRAAAARLYAADIAQAVGAPPDGDAALRLAEAALLAGDGRPAQIARDTGAARGLQPAEIAALDLLLVAAGGPAPVQIFDTALARRIDLAPTGDAAGRMVAREVLIASAAGAPAASGVRLAILARGLPATGVRPSAAVMALIDLARARSAHGEAAMLALLAAADIEPGALDGEAAAAIIAALVQGGFAAEARAFAVEAIAGGRTPPPPPPPPPAPRPRTR
jgi:hypothetical protein